MTNTATPTAVPTATELNEQAEAVAEALRKNPSIEVYDGRIETDTIGGAPVAWNNGRDTGSHVSIYLEQGSTGATTATVYGFAGEIDGDHYVETNGIAVPVTVIDLGDEEE